MIFVGISLFFFVFYGYIFRARRLASQRSHLSLGVLLDMISSYVLRRGFVDGNGSVRRLSVLSLSRRLCGSGWGSPSSS